ncbi:MAG: tRNA pseudouridine(55) synthase TruB [Candidatus Gastranaerophilales bacterium]|nr:tRNA pseudouridine(55) synthase TruB [Candidatus Gastranaerophilales bacterium]
MEGYFLNINKPKGISSFDVIRQLRKKLNLKAIGHSGTLDPLAHGVMQIGVGYCTKLLDYLASDKEYTADICFGYDSTTMDEEGEKTFIKTPDFTYQELITTLNSFLGKTMQVPPKYSAIKQNGKKLCDLARNNPDMKLVIKPREIEIYSIDLLDFKQDFARIKVHAKKGTYIRSLVNDIGVKLNCGAYIKDLKRTKAGNFLIENSQDINSSEFVKINPLNALQFDKYEVDDIEYRQAMNGNTISVNKIFKTNPILLTKNNKLVSLANILDNSNNGVSLVKPKKNFKES